MKSPEVFLITPPAVRSNFVVDADGILMRQASACLIAAEGKQFSTRIRSEGKGALLPLSNRGRNGREIIRDLERLVKLQSEITQCFFNITKVEGAMFLSDDEGLDTRRGQRESFGFFLQKENTQVVFICSVNRPSPLYLITRFLTFVGNKAALKL